MIEYLDDKNKESSIYVLLTDTGTLFTTLVKRLIKTDPSIQRGGQAI